MRILLVLTLLFAGCGYKNPMAKNVERVVREQREKNNAVQGDIRED